MGKVKRTLSILLAVAMVVTCVPQTGLSALAANETPGITEAAETEAAEVKVETPENDSEVTDDAEAEDAADGEDSTEVIGEGGEAQTPVDDEKAQEPVADDEAAEEVEEPAEGEVVVDSAIDPDQATVMEGESSTSKNLWPIIGIKDENRGQWKLTAVSPLPAEAGKTYLTVGTAGTGDSAWDGFFAGDINYSDIGIAENALAGKILAFGAQPQDGYQFKSENEAEQVKATLIGQKWTGDNQGNTDIKVISAAYVNGHYEIDLEEAVEAAAFEDYDGMRLSVWADVVEAGSGDTGDTEVEGKTISLSDESEQGAIYLHVGDEEYCVTKESPCTISDPEQRCYVEVLPDGFGTLIEVMYMGESDKVWTSLYPDEEMSDAYSGRFCYMIPRDKLSENLQIKVVNMREIILDWVDDASWGSVTITASAVRNQSDNTTNQIIFGDKLGDPNESNPYADTIYAPKDSKVELTISPKAGQNIELSRVALRKWNDAAANAVDQTLDNKGTAKFVVADNIVDDYIVTIKGTGKYQKAVLTTEYGEEEIVPDKSKNYSIAPRATYRLKAEKAGGRGFAIGKLTIKDAAAKTEVFDSMVEKIGYNNGEWDLVVKATAGGMNLLVEIYANAADEAPIDTITLKVAPRISSVTIKGAKNSKITQQIGTEVKYALTPDDKLSKDTLGAYIQQAAGDSYSYDYYNKYVDFVSIDNGGNLVVKTSAGVKEQTAAATIVITNENDYNYNSGQPKIVATVTLDTLAPAWVTAQPTLKQASATDTKLSVDITAPKGAVLPAKEDAYEDTAVYYYMVKVTKKGETTPIKSEFVQADGQTTRHEIVVDDKAALGEGKKADYEVTAQLLLYSVEWGAEKDGQPADTKDEIAESKVSAVLKHSTRDPYYADKITLKKEKAASALYTGQEAHVATVDFGKVASYNSGADVEIYDIPEGLSVLGPEGWVSEGNKTVLKDDLKVIVRAYRYMTPGKYTIKARTTYQADENNSSSIVQATDSVQVTVVQGIYYIEASAPAQIYTTDKGTTAKIAVTYNGDVKEDTPKTKKVTYDLVGGDGYDNIITVPGITVNNGTIKVDKSYVISRDQWENTHTVLVKAADYAGNETKVWVTFEVTGKATALGNVALVKWEDGGYKDLTPAQGDEIAINKINDSVKVVVVKPNRNPVHGKYRWEDFVESKLYTLTLPKGIEAWDDMDGYTIHANQLGKNLVIKATASDGGKASVQTGKFSIVYNDSVPQNEAKVIYQTNLDFVKADGSLEKGGTTTLTNVPAGTVITLSVADKEGNSLSGDPYWAHIFDYVLSAKNAKVVKKYNGGLSLDIIVTKNPAEITLKKGKEEVGKYFINIPDLSGEDEKIAAPKISLKKGTKIYPSRQDQELGFTMNNVVAGARYVKVSCQDNEYDTRALYECLSLGETGTTATLNANTKEFSFDLNLYGTELKKGASLAFVFLDRDGNVLTKTSNTLKIKTTALKKSYKLDAKYTLSTKDAFSTQLTGKGSGVVGVKFDKLYNANLKGTVNKFRTGFDLTEDGRLELQTYPFEYEAGKWEVRAVAEKADWVKNDFIGFVEYTVTYEDDSEETYVSKIQVDLKKTDKKGKVPTAKKYTASAVNVLNPGVGNTTEGVAYVTTGKLSADIRAAYIIYDSADKGVEIKKVNGNEITLTVKGAAKNTTYNKWKLYVLPLSGMYAYDNNYKDWGDTEWEKYGVELKCNVSLKAANSKGKIKQPAKSVSFLNVEPEKLALDGVGKEYYYAELPYTVGIFAQINDKDDAIKLANKKPGKDPLEKEKKGSFEDDAKKLIKVRKVSNKNALGLYIDAEGFKALVNDTKEWSGAVFSQIEMTVPFAGTGAVEEKINISLTMPNPWNAISSNEEKLARIISVINGGDVKINGIAYSSYDAAERLVVVTANDPDVKIQTAVDAAKDAMADELLKDTDFSNWVGNIASIEVTVKPEGSTQYTREISNSGDKKAFLIKVVDKYTSGLINELQDKGITDPTWSDLENEKIELEITANPKPGLDGVKAQTERCRVTFKVDENAGDDLDSAIARAVKKLSDEEVIYSITGEFDRNSHTITIHGDDPYMDFIDSKNQGRDKTIQILLAELGEHMDKVSEIKFSHESDGVRDSITVKKEGRETSEQYIANLVDKWTDKLVNKLAEGYEDEGNPNAYGRLRGEELFVDAKMKDGTPVHYTITFDCEELKTGGALDDAIERAIESLNEADAIPGVATISYDRSGRSITIEGNDPEQDIMASKNEGETETVAILLAEMKECMDEVSEVTFTHTEDDVTDSITVKKDGRETTEEYISKLVDKWTDKVVGALTAEGKPATYGSLDGEVLEVKVKYSNPMKPERTYTMTFVVE